MKFTEEQKKAFSVLTEYQLRHDCEIIGRNLRKQSIEDFGSAIDGLVEAGFRDLHVSITEKSDTYSMNEMIGVESDRAYDVRLFLEKPDYSKHDNRYDWGRNEEIALLESTPSDLLKDDLPKSVNTVILESQVKGIQDLIKNKLLMVDEQVLDNPDACWESEKVDTARLYTVKYS